MDEKYFSREIRRLILKILHTAALAGKTQAGSWLNLLTLREILSTWGHDLSDLELRRHCVYLADPEIRCLEIDKVGKKPPYIYRYRIMAKGVRVIEGEETVPGIADE